MVESLDEISEVMHEVERQASDPLRAEVVLDFAKTQAISSPLINQLLRTSLRLRMTDRRLLLINVQPEVCEIFRMLRLDRTIEFDPAPICQENAQPSPDIRRRFDAGEKSPFFLRWLTSRAPVRTSAQ